MKNTLVDLNNNLFEMLERVNNPDTKDEDLEIVMKRANTMVRLSETIIHTNELAFNVYKHGVEYGCKDISSLPSPLNLK